MVDLRLASVESLVVVESAKGSLPMATWDWYLVVADSSYCAQAVPLCNCAQTVPL